MAEIKSSDILPDGLPIWDCGTMLRAFTSEETRAFCNAYHQLREENGRLNIKYHLEIERAAKEHRKLMSLLYALCDGNTELRHILAKREAMEILKKEAFEPWDDE